MRNFWHFICSLLRFESLWDNQDYDREILKKGEDRQTMFQGVLYENITDGDVLKFETEDADEKKVNSI